MTSFKLVVSDPSAKKSYQKEVDQAKTISLVGKKIGDQFSGDIVELNGYTLQLTGGTDKDGFPMHPSLKGSIKKKVLLSGPPGFYPKLKGQRKRKTVRGDTLSQDIMQINLKVVKAGEKPLGELIPMKPKEGKPDANREKPEKKEVVEKPEVKDNAKEKQDVKKEEKTEPKPEEKPAENKETPQVKKAEPQEAKA